MQAAAEDLLSLNVDGLQLTPGLAPTENFSTWLENNQVNTRTHHGFCWDRLRRRVWSDDGDCLVTSDSIHPPLIKDACCGAWWKRLYKGDYHHLVLETMYPGYCLGNSEELTAAMDLQLKLAVDVSHIYIQLSLGSLTDTVWRRLQDYEYISELHLSSNTGACDIHQPIDKNTFGYDWVKERTISGGEIPIILECYMHGLSQEQRAGQIQLVTCSE